MSLCDTRDAYVPYPIGARGLSVPKMHKILTRFQQLHGSILAVVCEFGVHTIMMKTGLRAIAASMSSDAWFCGVGVNDLARSAGPRLGLRVSCGEQFRMGVNVCEASSRASMRDRMRYYTSYAVQILEHVVQQDTLQRYGAQHGTHKLYKAHFHTLEYPYLAVQLRERTEDGPLITHCRLVKQGEVLLILDSDGLVA